MNLITQYLHSDHIILDAPCTNKKRSFEMIAQHFATLDGLSAHLVYDALASRERMASTGLGYGVAIPHGRVQGLQKTLCTVMRLKTPIDFEAPDGVPVQFMVALLVPEHAGQVHLDCLGELANLLSFSDFRQDVLNASSATDVYRAFLTHQFNSSAMSLASEID
jgi:nitrogen PTS system EIIA component